MKMSFLLVVIPISFLGLVACDEQSDNSTVSLIKEIVPMKAASGRWYNQDQVDRGDKVFQANCAVCHKANASGTKDWKKVDANDEYPPPPLDGTAHTWHHPLALLQRTVRKGGVSLGGTMPGFENKLNAEEIDDTLAWVQAHWPDRIYKIWSERNDQTVKSN